jgi:acetoin utilization deacetylase AcuC-like enzyme
MKVGWVDHPRLRDHQTGRGHVECPERLEVIVRALREAGLLTRLEPLTFSPATNEQLALVHDPAYVDIVRILCEEGFTFVGDSATTICSSSFDVAAVATGGVLAACDAVITGQVDRAFCAVRPPGHHASADQALGFCLFNHVATAAEHLLRTYRLQRVAVVDFDVHHGNGTQNIFEERAEVYYVSLHERPESLPFPGSGHHYEVGRGAGRGKTLNIPLDRGSTAAVYLEAIQNQVLPALEAFEPEFLLLSAGFDALAWDNIANMSLDPESYGPLTAELVRAAERHAAGRVVSVLEGGYDLGHLGAAVVAHVRALLDTT